MEIKPAGHIPYSEETWNEFLHKLVRTLLDKGALDASQISQDSEAKEFITTYVDKELLSEDKEAERLILGTNIRLIHLDVDSKDGKRTFPLINEYKVHHLMKTYYFYKEDNQCKIGCIDVVDKIIKID